MKKSAPEVTRKSNGALVLRQTIEMEMPLLDGKPSGRPRWGTPAPR